jgi:allophanate hydrolase
LEILMLGPTMKVVAESLRVALVGCSASMEIEHHNVKRRVPSGRSVRLVRDDVLRIPFLGDSVCAYLAIEGGLAIHPVLGSTSTYVPGGVGGFKGRRLQEGDLVPLTLDDVEWRAESVMMRALPLRMDDPIRVILGPQADYFTEGAVETFLASEYTVSLQSDRMGFRLDGPTLTHSKGYNIVSDGAVTGSIQVPGSGRPIVLMVDNPTTGGYPKIATVISSDIPTLGRRAPGRPVRFVPVTIDEAHAACTQQEKIFEELSQFENVVD